MEQERALSLLLRQLKDIQAQATKIVAGENSNETIETFARYSSELKIYIQNNVASQEVKAYITELPDIDYSSSEIKLWQYLIWPSWWITLYKDYQVKNKTITEINHAKGKYATLELLVRGLTN